MEVSEQLIEFALLAAAIGVMAAGAGLARANIPFKVWHGVLGWLVSLGLLIGVGVRGGTMPEGVVLTLSVFAMLLGLASAAVFYTARRRRLGEAPAKRFAQVMRDRPSRSPFSVGSRRAGRASGSRISNTLSSLRAIGSSWSGLAAPSRELPAPARGTEGRSARVAALVCPARMAGDCHARPGAAEWAAPAVSSAEAGAGRAVRGSAQLSGCVSPGGS